MESICYYEDINALFHDSKCQGCLKQSPLACTIKLFDGHIEIS
jgi:hypothetical protein